LQPQINVVMSVYNGEKYLREAVDSILAQTFRDFEFIIIDDGSTDGTPAILESYDDSRIGLVHNQENIGLTRSLNKGLALAQGKYVARMDADDVAMPHRFEKQVAFLEKYPGIGILGSSCQMIDTNGREQGLYQVPTSDLQIRWTSLLANPFWHPTVMMRRDVLIQNGLSYDEAFRTTQDYDLWMRMLKYTRGANLGEPLIRYRLYQGITSTHRETQLENHDRIALRTIQEQLSGFVITLEQVSQLRALFVGGSRFTPGFDAQRVTLAQLYLDMFEAFTSRHPGEPDLNALQRQEAMRVARLVLRRPLQPGWICVVGRLITIDPKLLWFFWGYFSNAIGRRLGRHALDILHRLFA
jgi:hypothetical protein